MPRPKKQAGDPTALRNPVSCLVTDNDMAMIKRVRDRYGVSQSDAVRILIRAGAPQHDPSLPHEGK